MPINHRSARSKSAGFTLIEMVVYIALFSIVIGGALVSMYHLLESEERNGAALRVHEEGTFIQKKNEWALIGAQGAQVSMSGDVLTIERPDLGGDSPLVFRATQAGIFMSRGSNDSIRLTTHSTIVEDTHFTFRSGELGIPPSVVVEFEISDRTFYLERYLANAYE